jgi:hypothetical protein
MKPEFYRLIKNIEKLQNLPLKRYNWAIEMAVLNLDIEIGDFIQKYEKYLEKKPK